MMTRAYDKFFLPIVMKNLGFAVDYAVNECGVSADSFFDFFIASKVAKAIEEGSPVFTCDCSGTELAELEGVNLRTLQQYEIGSKDINKASGRTINSLALALHCNFYDVMELEITALS